MDASKYVVCLCLVLGIGLGRVATADEETLAYGEGFDVALTSSGIVLKDDVVYMTWPSGARKAERFLAAIDVSDVGRPKLLSKLPLPGFPQDLAVAGSHAYVVNGRALLVIDVSNPASMKLAGRLAVSEDPMAGPQGIDVSGAVAYLACRRGGVRAVDISKPDKPEVVSACKTAGFAGDVTASGDMLYVACGAKGLQVVDIADPHNLRTGRRMEAPSGVVGGIAIADDVGILAGGDTLVACVAKENGQRPTWLGSTDDRHVLSPFYGSYAFDVAILETGSAGNEAQPGAGRPRPVRNGGGPPSPFEGGPQSGVVYACVADGEGGLIVADVSDPTAPRFAGALIEDLGLGGHMFTSLCMQGDTVYMNDDSYGLRVVNVSTPAEPKLLGEGLSFR